MKQMEEMILKEGVVLPGEILKVGSFLNQNIDTTLLVKHADITLATTAEVEALFAA